MRGTEELRLREALPEDRASECTKHVSHQILTTALFPDVEVTCLEVTCLVSTSPKW